MNVQKLLLLTGMALLAGCSVFRETGDETSAATRLREYEASFRPSDYDEPLRDFFPSANDTARADSIGATISSPQRVPEFIQGYRVQVLATTSYDEVNRVKTTIEEQIPDEWFYVVYDAPTYKLRAGNFQERYEADRFAKLLGEKGYKDAWVVPEKVYKNPGVRPAPPTPPDSLK